jgi:hypothetical protein
MIYSWGYSSEMSATHWYIKWSHGEAMRLEVCSHRLVGVT